ncbi:MAG: AI-2E family transporter [Chitinophagaceae bacterium]|nr:AI-2E family transporter [Chitinophagaceae bacterium]MCW5915222.1 AI-2E family transporter [Chitinophagaceae bacterium]MCZ2396441.1 AI-2E family transporter [Chitinophagales bacterium]
MKGFNDNLRQILFLGLIIFIGILMLKHFYVFLPGVLGAVTLYILSRQPYRYLTNQKRWSKGWTSLLFILGYTVIICLPVYLAAILLTPKLVALFNNPVQLMVAVQTFSDKVYEAIGVRILDPENLKTALERLANNIPALLSGTANFLTNLLLMFFVLYYMLSNGDRMERYSNNILPMKQENRDILGRETVMMIRANGIGIPLLAIIQGLVSMLGYFIFGITEYGVWAFLTGIASLVPIVGTGLIWVPLVIYLFTIGQTGNAIGLGIYSLVVTGNVDYFARITLLKKIGDVHPLITIFGVIIGLSMFGFIGLVFGPLLISYFILLVKIYRNEFSSTLPRESNNK